MASNDSNPPVAHGRNLHAGLMQQLAMSRGLTRTSINAMPEAKLQRAVRRLDYPDLPRAREAFRLLQETSGRGQLPPNALVNAITQVDSLRSRAVIRPRVAGVPTGREVQPRALVAPLAGLSPQHTGWTSLGPGNIGGRTRSIVVHPTNPTTLWAGSVGGGVWRTDDGGVTWNPVDDLMANLAVCCLAMDPANPNILYAGTGEGFSNLDALRGAGIFVTQDGTNWTQIASTTGPDFQAVNRLALSGDGKVLLAATGKGLFRSEDPERLTWTKVLTDRIADVDFHPTDSDRAVAGGVNNGQAYYSTDGGITWTTATHTTPWSGRVELTYALGNPNTVYASVQMISGEIWRSTNGGKSYQKRAGKFGGQPVPYLGDQGWYDNVIWAGDPTNANLVIVGGVDLWRSTNGGNTLRDISTWWDPRSAHADQHCIVSHPGYDGTTNRKVFFGNDGGIYTTDDVKAVGNDFQPPRVSGWVELDNTYGVTQFYGGAGNVATGTIIGGAQDNGTLRYTPAAGSEQWTSMFGGDGGYCAADPTDPDVFYGEYVFLNIHRSTDGGANSDYISGQFWDGQQWNWKPVPFRIPDARSNQALFIAPFVLDPNEPNRILAGGLSLWRTDNAKAPNTNSTGPSWASIKTSAGALISAIAVAPGNADIVWVGHEDGQIYKATDTTSTAPTWQRIDQTGASPLDAQRYCTRIVIDPGNTDIVYIMFGGYNKGNIWKTGDGGTTWSNIGNALPEAPVRTLAIHPRNSASLYLGTEVGVFASEDAGATWSPTNEGPTNCSVDELFWMGETLICATHGRGMFSIDLSTV